jgi:hypothetical protein
MILFTLKMPNRGSWNGQWSGQDNIYAVVKSLTKSIEAKLDGEQFTHAWKDGWVASIDCKKIDSKEAAKIRRKSQGFCGYDWMIDNIIRLGSAYND